MAASIARTANPAGVSASANVATYSSVAIGDAASNRIVVVAVASELASTPINSCTIDYGSGDVAMNAGSAGNFGSVYARLFYLLVPTGTTATIKVTFGTNSPTSTQNNIAVYRVIGGAYSSAGSDGSTDMDTTDPLTTGSITIPTDGVFIAVAGKATDTTRVTWANATEDLDVDAGAFGFTTATRATALSATAVTCTTATTDGEDGALSYLIFAGSSSPTVALNSPADASSGSDTTPTLNFTGTDADSDTLEYEVQVDTVNTFDSQDGAETTIEGYSESNYSSSDWIIDHLTKAVGQTISPSFNGKIAKVSFYIKKGAGSPTGNCYAKLYAITGTHGTSGLPTGAALATSNAVSVASLSASYSMVEFTFGTPYLVSSGTKYVITFEYADGTASDTVNLGDDGTSPTHGGNEVFYQSGSWSYDAAYDVCFLAKGTTLVPLIDALSASDAGFTAGHPFASGSAIDYTVQSALSAGTYYWRVRAIDPSGSNTYGAWSSTRSFTITAGGNVRLINIGDNFKTVTSMKVNIGDLWKDVVSVKVNVGDVWKTII